MAGRLRRPAQPRICANTSLDVNLPFTKYNLQPTEQILNPIQVSDSGALCSCFISKINGMYYNKPKGKLDVPQLRSQLDPTPQAEHF
jgi:hypothetical protein